MLSRVNSMGWSMDGKDEASEGKEEMEMGAISTFKSMLEVEDEDWYLTASSNQNNNNGGGSSSINIPDPDCENNNSNIMQQQGHSSDMMRDLTFPANFNEGTVDQNLILQLHHIEASASCSPSPAAVYNNNLDQSHQVQVQPQQQHYFLDPPALNKGANMLSGLGSMSNTHFDNTCSFNLGCDSGFLDTFGSGSGNGGVGVLGGGFCDLTSQNQIGVSNLNSANPQFSTAHLLQMPQNTTSGFGSFVFGEGSRNSNSIFLNNNNNRSKLLQPLDHSFPSSGTQPTLFQKRAALRKNLGSSSTNNRDNNNNNDGKLGGLTFELANNNKKKESSGNEFSGINSCKSSYGDDFEDPSIEGSILNYDSDELTENTTTTNQQNEGFKNGENSSLTAGGEENKGGIKKKGLPAKNLMAERRRRKKLNDRLYMLRSVVPKISKMDRASILGDAIEYLKELLQKINDLQNELESSNTPTPSSGLTPTTFYPLTPTASTISNRIKEELSPSPFASPFASPLPSPTGQPVRVEVREREGGVLNIHMFCGRRHGLLLSTMKALESLGLDIQQAVISCFNGFALDVFRAEQCKDGQEVSPEHIRALLLDSAGFHLG